MILQKFCTAVFALALTSTMTRAQTPGGPGEGAALTRDPATGACNFAWWGRPGRTYFLQQSADLRHWTYLPLIEPGAGRSIGWAFTSTDPRGFLRLKYTDAPTADPFNADFDGDGVSNWDELMQGTDPFVNVDSDGHGLPDDWQIRYFGHLGVDPDADPDGDGLTNLQEFQQGSDPGDFFNGQAPTLAKASGDEQTAPPGRLLPAALVVAVTDPGGAPVANAEVAFSIVGAAGLLKAGSSAPLTTAVAARTDAGGQARVYCQLPAQSGQTCQVLATVGTGSSQRQATFVEHGSAGVGNPVPSPFAPTNFVSQGNPDGSLDMSWENHTDDQTPVEVEIQRADGSWNLVAALPPGTTSYHCPAQ